VKRARRTPDRKRLLLRLLQISPLIPLMFNGLVWISVPNVLRGQILTMRSILRTPDAAAYITEDTMRQTITMGFISEQQLGATESIGDDSGRIQYAGEQLTMGSQESTSGLEALYEDRSPFPWDTADPMFDALERYETDIGADVYAFAVLRTGLPQLIAQSEQAPDLLFTEDEAMLELLPDEYTWAKDFPADEYSLPPTPTVDTSILDEQWKVAWYSDAYGYGDLAPFPDLLMSGGYGMGDDRRMVSTFSHVHEGELYASIWVGHQPDPEESMLENDPFTDPRLNSLDPTADDVGSVLDDIARKYSCNAYLVGPLEGDFVPVWCSTGCEDAAAAIAEILTPGLVSEAAFMNSTLTDDALPPIVGEGMTLAVQAIPGRAGGTPQYTESAWPKYTAPTVLFLTAYAEDTVPGVPALSDEGPLGNAIRDVRIWIAMNMHWMLNTGIALLMVSLVLSPSAFIYERNMIARERLVEEMERVQRDAHDKVYNRLSALSKRVEMTSDELSADVARSLSSVAGDIRDTVAELQDILGDTRSQTAAIVGVDPLRSQLEHVCRSQAERLGIRIEFEAPDVLPVIASQLGWDLQCVLEEAITNSVRHGGAQNVRVTVEPHATEIELAVQDDGRGLERTSIDELPESSTGLRGMRDRLRLHGGSLDIASGETGTTLTASVPIAITKNGNGG